MRKDETFSSCKRQRDEEMRMIFVNWGDGMKKWIQNIIIGLVAFLTLGIITPAHDIWDNIFEKESKQINSSSEAVAYDIEVAADDLDDQEDLTNLSYIEESFIMNAKQLSFEKFGAKIGPKIESEFERAVFPKMDEVIRTKVFEVYADDWENLAMSKKPSGSYGEKIFNIHDSEKLEDVARFHVRTEKRPKEGYYFNFHYHLAEDEFEQHHHLGDIYYSKDTPPKWMS